MTDSGGSLCCDWFVAVSLRGLVCLQRRLLVGGCGFRLAAGLGKRHALGFLGHEEADEESGALDLHHKVTPTIPAGRMTPATTEACRLIAGRLPVCARSAALAARG